MRALQAAAGILIGLAVTTGANAEDVTLRIANYGGLFSETTQKCTATLFTAKTGVKVVMINANPTDHLAKLLAGQGKAPPFDLFYLDDGPYAQGVDSGLFEKLDPAVVTNLEKLYPSAKLKDNSGVVVSMGSIGIAYNAKILREKGIPDITSWADLWDPRLAGHVALPDVTTSAGMNLVNAAAWQVGGDERDVKTAFEKIAAMKANSFFTSSADAKVKFQSGDVWAAPWYNGRAWQMINEGFPMKFVHPDNRAFALFNILAVVKGTKYSQEAMQYVNFQLDPLAQLCTSYGVPYAPTNVTLEAVMKGYPKLSEQFPSPDEISKLYVPDWASINKGFPKWLDAWNRTVLR